MLIQITDKAFIGKSFSLNIGGQSPLDEWNNMTNFCDICSILENNKCEVKDGDESLAIYANSELAKDSSKRLILSENLKKWLKSNFTI